MILTMAYLLLVAALLGLAALFGERICAALDWPRRGVWLAALTASLALPALVFLAGESPSGAVTPLLSLPPLLDQLPAFDPGIDNVTAEATATSSWSFNWPDWRVFDSALGLIWIVSSAALLLSFALAAWRMRGIVGRVQQIAIGNQPVLIADRLGPAVIGFIRPRIVLPRWIADQDSALRAQVLSHEREHIAARDQLALLAALLIVAVMPWNLALWWQLRRLRTAIEFDCDGRVLNAGADARDYSEALLTVGRRALRTPFAAVALTEPVSELERRIRNMLDQARRFSSAGIGARSLVVVSLLLVACAVNAPGAQQPRGNIETAPGPRVTSVQPLRAAISERLAQASNCIYLDGAKLEAPDFDCARRLLAEVAGMPDLNAHEAGRLHMLAAMVDFQTDDLDGAIAEFEALRALPSDELPPSLVSSGYQTLVGLYAMQDRPAEALVALDLWLALPSVTPTARDLYNRAQLLYALERLPEALAATERAVAATSEPPEPWYQMLYALQYMTGDEAGARETLATLNANWPNERWTRALQGSTLVEPRTSRSLSDDYLPITRVSPIYPPRAQARGIEGYVIVRYTVTTDGRIKDVEVVESSASLFERAAIDAALRYRYRPRVIDGTPIEVAGVRDRVEFRLQQND